MALDKFRRIDMQINRANDYQIETQFVKEGDYNGRELVVQITDAGEVSNQSGVSLNLGWKHNSAGNSGLDPFTVVDASKGIFKITYPTEMLITGDVTASIQVLESGRITLTRNFKITVENNPIDEGAIVSENSFTVLQEALVKVNDLEDNYAPRLNEVTAQLAQTDTQLKDISINVKFYGAKGDGITDDTKAIQDAIDFVSSKGGGKLFFPSGTYIVTPVKRNSCLIIQSDNIEVYGNGDNSIIKTNDENASVFLLWKDIDKTKTIENISIHDITVQGVGIYKYPDSGSWANHTYEPIAISIYGYNVAKSKFYNLKLFDMGAMGIQIANKASECEIRDNVISGCLYTSININGTGGLSTVINNKCSDCDVVAIQICGHVNVDNNTVFDCRDKGLMVGENNFLGQVSVTNNKIIKCNVGIYAVNNVGTIISFNTVINCKQVAGKSESIGINVNKFNNEGFSVIQRDTIVSNNVLINNIRHIGAFAEGCIVSNNQCLYIQDTTMSASSSGIMHIESIKPMYNIYTNEHNTIITGNNINGGALGILYPTQLDNLKLSSNNIFNVESNKNICIENPHRLREEGGYFKSVETVNDNKHYPSFAFADYKKGDIVTLIEQAAIKKLTALEVGSKVLVSTTIGSDVVTVDSTDGLRVGSYIFFVTTVNTIANYYKVTQIIDGTTFKVERLIGSNMQVGKPVYYYNFKEEILSLSA